MCSPSVCLMCLNAFNICEEKENCGSELDSKLRSTTCQSADSARFAVFCERFLKLPESLISKLCRNGSEATANFCQECREVQRGTFQLYQQLSEIQLKLAWMLRQWEALLENRSSQTKSSSRKKRNSLLYKKLYEQLQLGMDTKEDGAEGKKEVRKIRNLLLTHCEDARNQTVTRNIEISMERCSLPLGDHLGSMTMTTSFLPDSTTSHIDGQQSTATSKSHRKRSRILAEFVNEPDPPPLEVDEPENEDYDDDDDDVEFVPPTSPKSSESCTEEEELEDDEDEIVKKIMKKRRKLSDPEVTEETENDWASRPCGICKEIFDTATEARIHMHQHEVLESRERSNKENPNYKRKPDFHCPFCPKVYYLEEALKVHVETERRVHISKYFSDLRFRCDGENGKNECCRETYETFEDLGHHLETRHPGATIHHCGTCMWPFLNESARDLHQLNHITRIKEGGRKKFCCPIFNCPIFARQITRIVGHFSTAHGTGLKPYPCPQEQCSYRGYTIQHINTHLAYTHKTTTLNDKPVEFSCEICSVKTFKTLQQLKAHRKVCRKTGICDICGAKLRNSKELAKHKLQVHQVEPPRFTCDLCGKVLLSEAMHKLHMRQHEKREPKTGGDILCPHCGKVFHREQNLKQHIAKIHVKETTGQDRKKDSVCQDCGNVYFSEKDLNRHRIMNHLSEEEQQKRRDRFRCPLCQKGFLILRYLKGHIIKVHKLDPNETLNTIKWKRFEPGQVEGTRNQTQENSTNESELGEC